MYCTFVDMHSLYSMWADDERWYPTMLADKRFKAYYLFEGHDKILEERLEVLEINSHLWTNKGA